MEKNTQELMRDVRHLEINIRYLESEKAALDTSLQYAKDKLSNIQEEIKRRG